MLILTGRNLGERHRELNLKVKEAAAKNLNFDQVKDITEKSDVEKLFKIDLASKYMNIDYIIEVLKSGDSLYISRALKCVWIYGDEFTNIFSVENLHNNVTPFMSTKMKKKLLSAISTYVRNEDRAAAFYKYSMESKLTSIALKFLNFTSNTFKLELLKDHSNCQHLISGTEGENLKHFIGLSFTLADAYVAIFYETNRIKVFRDLSYLYSVSDIKYLEMLEKSIVLNQYNNIYLGVRISRSIMKKHKNRVLSNPSLYVNLLNKNVLVRYSTAQDAKIYAVAVLPDNVENYWNQNYCNTYKFILDLIQDGKYEFIKSIFSAKYPGQEFEMNLNFYNLKYYKFMTAEEKETWALKQISGEAEILGTGKDYIWYKFVRFEKAFEEIKKLVMITPDQTKRADIMNILIEAAKNQRDVEKILKHYYERHTNEQRYTKENFLDRLLQYFNVYEFDEDCWMTLNKIFHSLEVYSMTDCHSCKSEYKIIALIYNIINKKDIHEAIKLYIRSNMYFYSLKLNTDKLSKEQQDTIFHYLFEFYMDEIKKSDSVPYDDEVKFHLRKYIHIILDLLDQYGRTKHDCPELVNKFMKLDWDEFQCHRLHYEPQKPTTKLNLLHYLKKDANLLVENLPLLKTIIDSSYRFNIRQVLKKLKIYFSNDIAKDYLKLFDELLTQDQLWYKVAHAAAHGIFHLADDSFKADFMTKYAPTEPKIKHGEISEKLLRIQEAICAHAYYSRPPVPLKYMLMYIKGDYVHFCLPLFHSYLANLPLPLCMEFIEAILNAPVSIQKHGIRLAFECFSAENLNKLVTRVWKKTKNISLRMIIFKAVYNKLSKGQYAHSKILFDTLKTITLTLRHDDNEELFGLLASQRLPTPLMPEYMEVAWTVVNQLPLKPTNLTCMRNVLENIDIIMHSMRQGAVRDIVNDFIASEFNTAERGDKAKTNNKSISLTKAKWDLTAKYITYIQNKEDLDAKLELTKFILTKCLGALETGIHENRYLHRQLCFIFINNLENKSYGQDFKCYGNVNIIMQFVLKTLQDILAIEEIYVLVWELRLGIEARKVIAEAKMKLEDKQANDDTLKNIAINFGQVLGNLIKEFVEKELYFASFSQDIEKKIRNKTRSVKNVLNVPLNEEHMIISVSLGLMQNNLTEIHLLVLSLIPPVNNPVYEEDYKSIINKIKTLDNQEIRCNLYKKFVNTDFTVREFMHS